MCPSRHFARSGALMGGDSERRTRNEIRRELIDSFDEELEMELDDERAAEFAELIEHKAARDRSTASSTSTSCSACRASWSSCRTGWSTRSSRSSSSSRAATRPARAASIKRITQRLNPRVCRVVALPAPNERERTQWYFQRYVAAPAGRRRDRAVRPQLVQPRRRRARDGLLHRRTRSRSSSARCRSSSACWCARASS